ncbi:MAG: bifunctional riboflavin kinase/FAD synthetase [Proteobacteria bacterium]|nr:bifunctional riboflavin kinase/FAD synthetase [Pseudomonadota bacterium]
MEVFRGHAYVPSWQGSAVAIGNFDGVHLGHRALVTRTCALAGALGGGVLPVVLTFDPHPSALLAPHVAPSMLTSIARRCELLGEAGAAAVVVEPFTRELAGYTPTAFIDDVLLGALRARAIVVGYDFSYGQGRSGTIEALAAHGRRAGVEVVVVPPVEVDGEAVSSTRVRARLRAGELPAAARLLGHRYDLDGVVVHGAKRGRTIGIPTANIKPDTDLVLASGIYACTLAVEGGAPLAAVASLGTNPTFVDQGGLVLEVYVLDWPFGAEEIYDRRVRTTFVERLRGESKFDSVDALLVQIRQDIEQARRVLGG